MSDATHWIRLDIVVTFHVTRRFPELVPSLRAAGHRVRVVSDDPREVVTLGDDLPDLMVAECMADGAGGRGTITGLAEHGIPVLSPERVRAALDAGREGDLLSPFCPGGLA